MPEGDDRRLDSQVTRRVFLSTASGVITATVCLTGASEAEADSTLRDQVDVKITIQWNDGKPVKDSRVFDHVPNRLLGMTNADGEFFFTAAQGTIIRLVEPRYGVQQALFTVRGASRTDDAKIAGGNSLVMQYAEGWTL